jgi:hypothetical protein
VISYALQSKASRLKLANEEHCANLSFLFMKLRWRFGIISAVFLAIFSLYPQMKLIYLRGSEWQGNYAYNDIDEAAYASYVKALSDGRPRKNDPYTGRDESPETPQKESLFSIQFAAPYTLAIPARLFGISTPTMMTVGGATAAALTALAVFWLLFQMTGSNWYAMAGSLATLAGGALFAGEGAVSEVFFEGFSYPYFPGFRRYIPALAMPAFFTFVGIVWRMIDHTSEKRNDKHARYLILLSAVAVFMYAVFSYFYIWTTAAAWLACLAICWVVYRPDGYLATAKRLLPAGVGCGIVLLPYVYLLSHRSHTMDDVQLLVRTHAPDLARFPEYIAAAVLLLVAVGVIGKRFAIRSPTTLFVLSLAMSVFAVFNQQVVTGRSLQPIHYQVFIGNYVAGLALVSALGLFVRKTHKPGELSIVRWASALLAVVAASWGFVECHYTVRVLDDVNIARDEQMPLARRLTELSQNDPNKYKTIVMHLGVAEADDLPTIAPQATLWSRHQHVFTSITTEESKQRYYQYLYYQGVKGDDLARSMKHGDFVSMIALFGWGRHTDRLNSDFKPLTYGEIDAAAREYDKYISAFDPHVSPETIVSYLVVRTDESSDLTNFDRWYERGAGEQLGQFVLFHTTLRTQPAN